MADPTLNREVHLQYVCALLARLYDRGPAVCARVLANAQRGLAGSPELKVVAALVTVPPTFRAAADAAALARRCPPDKVAFAPRMQADAWLLAARAEEWAGRPHQAVVHAETALKALPGYPPALCWRVRAGLWEGHPEHLPALPDPLPPDLAWQRLRAQSDLARNPSVAAAEACVTALRAAPNTVEDPERALLAGLLKAALVPPERWAGTALPHCAEVTRAAERAVGPQAWMQIPYALEELVLQGQAEAALARLQRQEVAALKETGVLRRVARLVAGVKPTREPPADALGALEAAQLRLLSPDVPGEAEDVDLRQRVAAAREERWCRWVPALEGVCLALEAGLAALSGGGSIGWPLPDAAPLWAVWLAARAELLTWDGVAPLVALAHAACPPAARAAAGTWWTLYGWPEGDPPAPVDPAPSASELGPLAQAVVEAERELPDGWAAARTEPADRAEGLTAWEARLAQQTSLVARMWTPALRYRQATLVAASEPAQATERLHGLLSGPVADLARSQLALLDLAAGHPEDVDGWLDGVADRWPAIVYARALAAARRGEAARAAGHLEALETRFGKCVSAYPAAGRRLGAALAERAGDGRLARERLEAALADDPADAVAAARLSRIVIHSGYAAALEGREVVESTAAWSGVAASGRPRAVTWARAYRAVELALRGSEPEPAWVLREFQAGVRGRASTLAIRQVLARGRLAAGAPAEARSLVAGDGDQPPPWLTRTRFVVEAWHQLTQLWRPAPPPDERAVQAEVDRLRRENDPRGEDPEIWSVVTQALRVQALSECVSPAARRALAELDAAPPNNADEVVKRWHALVGLAVDGRHSPLNWPALTLPGLWSERDEERRAAAEALAAARNGQADGWSAVQRAALDAVLACESKADDALLAAYQTLEQELDQLPVDGPSLWLKLATVWFGRRNWQPLIAGTLPDCVADLAHPRVRQVVGLAYGCAAADAGAQGRMREALTLTRQARAHLQPLLGEGD
ncbi:MAG: hypothetical protein HYU66_04310 [Armatimonadetes bacterium]|nr:hypothetical protein [Armatimonadota bacterium]